MRLNLKQMAEGRRKPGVRPERGPIDYQRASGPQEPSTRERRYHRVTKFSLKIRRRAKNFDYAFLG